MSVLCSDSASLQADAIVLKGYMYLTRKHICFFAHMPDKEVSLNNHLFSACE